MYQSNVLSSINGLQRHLATAADSEFPTDPRANSEHIFNLNNAGIVPLTRLAVEPLLPNSYPLTAMGAR